MPRLFTALEIPQEISTLLSLTRGGLSGARWIDPENYHLTLRFVGDIDAPTADEIAGSLARIVRPGFTLRLDRLDVFGGSKPRSLFAAPAASDELNQLQYEHERIMQRIGLKPEGRKFSPHVTLARLRRVRAGDAARFLAERGDFSSPLFRVERFVLMSSRDSTGGGPYVIEESYPLAA